MRITFTISVILVLINAFASLLRGKRYIYERENQLQSSLADPIDLASAMVEEE